MTTARREGSSSRSFPRTIRITCPGKKMAMALDKQFMVSLKGKDFVLFAGLLDAATKSGLRAVRTSIRQIPSADNGQLAVVEAIAEFEDGRVFSGIGDAGPSNTAAMISVHALRMAETRAVGRAFRLALNVGAAMKEELGEDDDALPSQRPRPSAPVLKQAAVEDPEPYYCSSCGDVVEDKVAQGSLRLAGQVLCKPCGRKWQENQGLSQVARIPTGTVVG